jgi:YD repeat-containing protein
VKEVEAAGPPPLATYTYDLNGNRSSKTLENGTVASYSYDNARRLTQVKHTLGSSTLAQIDYTLNSVGNRTSKKGHRHHSQSE